MSKSVLYLAAAALSALALGACHKTQPAAESAAPAESEAAAAPVSDLSAAPAASDAAAAAPDSSGRGDPTRQ